MKKVIVIYVAIVTASIAYLLYDRGKISSERDRYRENTETLLEGLETMRIDSSRNAVETKRLRLTLDELEESRRGYMETIEDLELKIKNLQSVSRHELEASVYISGEIGKEKYLTLLEGKPITVTDSDPHKNIRLVIDKDSVIGDVTMIANLTQVVYAEYKWRFLWWRIGLKGIRQAITCDNPNVRIRYSEYLEIEK